MRGETDGQGRRKAAAHRIASGGPKSALAGAALALLLAGCGTSSLSSLSTTLFSSEKKPAAAAGGSDQVTDSTDVECPEVQVRSGASTLMIGGKGASTDPGVLDLRYQGSIIRTARECHLSAGVMTMKVGVEGRIITGPAGGPGTLDVPLRIAIVQEGVTPKAITSKLAHVPVTLAGEVDRVIFTHVEPDIVFPMPTPAGLIDSYVVYVGFDTMAEPAKRAPVKRQRAKQPG